MNKIAVWCLSHRLVNNPICGLPIGAKAAIFALAEEGILRVGALAAPGVETRSPLLKPQLVHRTGQSSPPPSFLIFMSPGVFQKAHGGCGANSLISGPQTVDSSNIFS